MALPADGRACDVGETQDVGFLGVFHMLATRTMASFASDINVRVRMTPLDPLVVEILMATDTRIITDVSSTSLPFREKG